MARTSGNAGRGARRQWGVSLAFIGFGLLMASEVLAHPGGLNAQGCHNNRKTGDYHCHRPQSALQPALQPVSRPVSSQLAMGDIASGSEPEQEVPTSPPARHLRTNDSGKPVCHVGPRGGTYTITSSGRKNYSGC